MRVQWNYEKSLQGINYVVNGAARFCLLPILQESDNRKLEQLSVTRSRSKVLAVVKAGP